MEALKDDDWSVRSGAAKALGRIGPQAAVALPALRKALSDPKDFVQFSAREAIEMIEE